MGFNNVGVFYLNNLLSHGHFSNSKDKTKDTKDKRKCPAVIFGPSHVHISTSLLGLITRLLLGDQVSSGGWRKRGSQRCAMS